MSFLRLRLLASAFLLFLTITVNAQKSASAPASTWKYAEEVCADFESGTYDDWTLTGDCWGKEPTTDQTFSGIIKGFGSKRFLCTLVPLAAGKGDTTKTGKAVSREFTIRPLA